MTLLPRDILRDADPRDAACYQSFRHHWMQIAFLALLWVLLVDGVGCGQSPVASDPPAAAPAKSNDGTAKASATDAKQAPGTTPAAPAKAADSVTELTDPAVGKDWVRIDYDAKKKPLGMQTAIVRYVGQATTKNGERHDVSVDLIGAVHVGDIAYYEELNKQFTQYDALLYELVAPPGTVVERGRGTSNAHPIGMLQNGMKSMLDLDHQLEKVDYTKPNFVHADMSPDQFAKAMQDRNESFLEMYFRLLGTALAQQSEGSAGGASDFEVLSALFAKDRPRRLKVIMAKQLSEMESLMVSFGGENGSAIITDRNKIALGVLKDQLASGKIKLGVFYGAGHLQDMDQRLRKDFGVKPVAIKWLTAWNLAERP